MAPDNDNPADRRDAQRHPADWPVTIRSDGAVYQGSCTNLSTTGMAVHGTPALPIGTIVSAIIDVAGGRRLETTAEVVRIQDPIMLGLRFMALEPNALMLLLRLLARQP